LWFTTFTLIPTAVSPARSLHDVIPTLWRRRGLPR
jgi:hypothetical protein